MNNEPFPIVVSFILALFAAFAVPTVIAFVLFSMLRREGKVEHEDERYRENDTVGQRPLPFPRHRFLHWDRD